MGIKKLPHRAVNESTRKEQEKHLRHRWACKRGYDDSGYSYPLLFIKATKVCWLPDLRRLPGHLMAAFFNPLQAGIIQTPLVNTYILKALHSFSWFLKLCKILHMLSSHTCWFPLWISFSSIKFSWHTVICFKTLISNSWFSVSLLCTNLIYKPQHYSLLSFLLGLFTSTPPSCSLYCF